MNRSNGEAGVVTVLRTAVGDNLQSVIRYTPTDYEWLYVKDEECLAATGGTGEVIVNGYRKRSPGAPGDELSGVGPHQVTIRLFERAMILHFPRGPEAGTVVSVDPAVGPDLAGFLSQCLDRLGATRDDPPTGPTEDPQGDYQ